MAFTILPAVDIAGGRSVRPGPTGDDTETTFGDAGRQALEWQAEGAEWIHLVDLDAAFCRGSNATLLASIAGELDIKVQVSGGIFDEASLGHALRTRCERINLASTALAVRKQVHPDRSSRCR